MLALLLALITQGPKPRPPALPSGPHRVSYLITHLVDSSRQVAAPVPGRSRRDLTVQIWYPTARSAAPDGPYLPDSGLAEALSDFGGISTETVTAWRSFRIHASPSGPLLEKLGKLRLVVLSHGLGSTRVLYSGIAQDLASHGYVVAAIDHPYGGLTVLPDGRILSSDADAGDDPVVLGERVKEWALDAEFVVETLLEGARSPLPELGALVADSDIAMIGHSLGGAAALQACRGVVFRACVDLDGAPFGDVADSGVVSPSLVLLSLPLYSDADLIRRGRTREQWNAMGERTRSVWRDIATLSGAGRLVVLRVGGTNHSSFSDVPFTLPEILVGFNGKNTRPERIHRITTTLIRSFFDRHLGSGRLADVVAVARRFPEVVELNLAP